MARWKKMSSAPQDGSHILVSGSGETAIAHWKIMQRGPARWSYEDGLKLLFEPQGWQPVPVLR